MHGAPVIEIEGLRATLRDRDRRFVLEAATLRIDAGAAFGLTGPSGAGKTLLLEILGLLRRPDPGGRYGLRLGGRLRDIGALWTSGGASLGALRGAAFGFVPQTGGLLPFLTLAENIALGPEICGRGDAGRIAQLVERLDLGGLLALRPGQLSIGQRQRGAIAAALAHDPAVVIADEPTAALDPENAARGLGLILEAAAEGGAAVLVCSHDHALLARFALHRLALAVTGDAPDGTVVSRLDAGPEGLGCA